MNISTYRPLSGSSSVKLPVELRSPRKGLINIKNKDQKCFLWCHVRHINPLKEHPERILKIDKKIAEKRDYDGIDFPAEEKDFSKTEVKTIYALTCLFMKISCFFQFMFLYQNF